jgi:uncharacterized membrane protein YkoI
MRALALTVLIAALTTPAHAAQPELTTAMGIALDAQPGWVLAAERIADSPEYQVLVVADDGEVACVHVAISDGSVIRIEPRGGESARDVAAEVLDLAHGIAPDLVALVERIDGISEGCSWTEVELEVEDGTLVAEIECRVGDVELELGFDANNERLVEVEVDDGEEDDEDDEDDAKDDEGDRASLGLTVVVTTDGFQVRGDAVSFPDDDGSLRRLSDGGDYPFDALSALLARIKADHPDEETVTVAAVGIIPYEVLVATLDACRKSPSGSGSDTLFPSVVIAAGAADSPPG